MPVSAIHYNGNVLCAISIVSLNKNEGKSDLKGRTKIKEDLIQICVLPLDSKIQPRKDVLPFDVDLKPRSIENVNDLHENRYAVDCNRIVKHMNSGLDYYESASMFEHWFENSLKPPKGKKILPLGCNWAYVQPLLKDWLNSYDAHFNWRYRDISVASLYSNDRADVRSERPFFPKQHLSYLASCVDVEYAVGMKNALEDCIAISEIYRRMILRNEP